MYASFLLAGGGAAISVVSFGFWQYFFSKFILGFGCGGRGLHSFTLKLNLSDSRTRS
jgi:OCT family organic cation transporter-like MFS transporter 4/5